MNAPQAPTAFDVGRSVSRNALASMAGRLVYLASRVALPPLILRHLSLEQYGLWAAAFIVVGYLGMSSFGVANVYVRYVAEYHARGDVARVNQLLSSGLAFTSGLGAVLVVALWLAAPTVVRWLPIAPALRPEAAWILFATGAVFAVEIAFGAFGQVLIGLHRAAAQTAVWTAASLVEAVLIVAFLGAGLGVGGLLLAFALRLVLSTVACAGLCVRALPGLSVAPRHVDRESLRLFWSYGAVVQLSGLLGIVLYSIEKLIAALTLGPAAAALFEVGEKFPIMVSGIPASLNGVLLPALSHLDSVAEGGRTRALYLDAARCISLLGGLLLGFLAAFAAPVIVLWLGPSAEYQPAILILAVFALAFQMHVVTGPGSALHRGTGAPARELVYPLTQLALVALAVPLGFALVGRTVPVIAVGVAASMGLSAAAYAAYTNRRVGIGQRAFLHRVWLPGLAPYGVAALAAWTVSHGLGLAVDDRGTALVALLAGASLYVPLAAAVLWRLLDGGERDAVRVRVAAATTAALGCRPARSHA